MEPGDRARELGPTDAQTAGCVLLPRRAEKQREAGVAKTQAIGICGQDIFDRYYLDNGNEARIKAAYENRDPRLKQTIVTPYEPVDCFAAGFNGDENMIGKQLRWPLYQQGTSGGDFWLDKRTSAYYCYRKYVRFLKGELIDRQRATRTSRSSATPTSSCNGPRR